MNAPAHVLARLKRFDSQLSLKWLGDRWGVYRRGAYLGGVPADKLGDGSLLVARLHQQDVTNKGMSAAQLGRELDNAEAYEQQQARESRKQELIDEAKEDYDYIARRQGRRISNVGIPA